MSEASNDFSPADDASADVVEPQFADATPDESAGPSLARRFGKIVFYGGSAAILALAVGVNASPGFAAAVGKAMPSQLAELSGADVTPCAGGSCGTAMMAASAGEPSCCSSLSRPALVSSMSSTDSCGGCPSQLAAMMASAEAAASGCCASKSATTMASAGESGCCSSKSDATLVSAEAGESSCCQGVEGCGGCDKSESTDDATLAVQIPTDDLFAGGL